MLFLFLALLFSVFSTECVESRIDCQDFTCTTGAFDGQLVDESKCPFERFGNTTMRVCRACAAGSTCVGSKCEDVTNLLGKACSSDEQCRPVVPDITRFPYSCIGGFCAINKTEALYAGDAGCTVDSDCYVLSTCSAGTCIEPVNCDEDLDCRGNRYCDKTSIPVCAPRILGKRLCFTSAECAASEMCVQGACESRFTLGLNDWCNRDEYVRRFGCAVNLQCVDLPLSTRAICQPSKTNAQLPDTCNFYRTDECPLGYTCQCDPETFKGQCYPISEDGRCAALWKSYFTCTFGAGCRDEHYDFVSPGMCVYDRCFSEWALLQECRYEKTIGSVPDGECEVTRLANIRAGNIILPFQPEDVDDAASQLESFAF